MVTQEELQQKQAEMQLRSTIRRSKQQSKNRLGKIKPRTEQVQLAATRASILTLIKGKMAQPELEGRTFAYLLNSYLQLSQKKETPTWKEFFSIPPREDDAGIIQIREPIGNGPSSEETPIRIADPNEDI